MEEQEEFLVHRNTVVEVRRRVVIAQPASLVRRWALRAANAILHTGPLCEELRAFGASVCDEAVAALNGSVVGINWNGVHADLWVDDAPRRPVRILGVLLDGEDLEYAADNGGFTRGGARAAQFGVGRTMWVAFGDTAGNVAAVAGREPHEIAAAWPDPTSVFDLDVSPMPRW